MTYSHLVRGRRKVTRAPTHYAFTRSLDSMNMHIETPSPYLQPPHPTPPHPPSSASLTHTHSLPLVLHSPYLHNTAAELSAMYKSDWSKGNTFSANSPVWTVVYNTYINALVQIIIIIVCFSSMHARLVVDDLL